MSPEEFNQKKPITAAEVDPENLEDIADYYQFEVANGFSKIPEQSSLEKMAAFRQRQIRENKLRVIKATESGQTVGTSIVVLENGAMGKTIKPDEAWAAGTVIDKSKRSQGIGEKLSYEQDRIARAAGKKSLLTTIAKDNFPSMRLRLKVGYELDGLDKRPEETNYFYRKNLTADDKPSQDWAQEVRSGNLKLSENKPPEEKETADQVLVDPADDKTAEQLLASGYKGVYLLRPEDFENEKLIDKNLLVFAKTVDREKEQRAADQKFQEEKAAGQKSDQEEISRIRKDIQDLK